MKFKYTNWLIGLALTTSLLACTDHRLGGVLSPVQQRLKTVSGSLNNTYTYDSQNRLATISKPTGGLSRFIYDDVQKYAEVRQFVNASDQANGIRLTLPYIFPNKDFSTTIYTFSSTDPNRYNPVDEIVYTVDPATPSHLRSVTRNYNSSMRDVRLYQYTGENITKGTFSSGRVSLGDKTYEYDDKINPFFGSTDPDIDDIQRFSRNNVLKITSTYPPADGGGVYDVISYQYEYNQQGLPTKRTTTRGGTGVTTYLYESY